MVEDTLLTGRYRLGNKIASGAMGTVYEAIDERLGRTVAVKLLKGEHVTDETSVERFRREARAVAALSHPNIASVFDYGEDEHRHFIVMELAEGHDLARVIREDGALSEERLVRIAMQACSALEHAHSAGVIHRDIKPANIIVGPNDRVKVTDFGIARAAGDATLTATGMVLGTAHYISPEHASGVEVTPRSDIYSLGIVIYEMATAALPFTGDSPISVALRHVSEDVPPPSSIHPVAVAIDDIVAGATARDPDDRFPDARALKDALRSIGAAETGEHPAQQTAVLPVVPEPQAAATIATNRPTAVWPVYGERWNPARVGRWVLITLAALALIATGALVYRLASTERPAARNQPKAAPGGADPQVEPNIEEPVGESAIEEPTPQPSESMLAETVIGQDAQEVAAFLTEAGYLVMFEGDEPPGIVTGTDPAPGIPLEPGETITLFVDSESDG